MSGLPEGTVLFGGRMCNARVLETKGGRVALVEWSDYCRGEAMGAISKRTGAPTVLLVDDGTMDAMTVDSVEQHLDAIAAELAQAPAGPAPDSAA